MATTTLTKTRLQHPAQGDNGWLTPWSTGMTNFEARWRYKGSSAPSNLFAGMYWIDDSSDPWLEKIYDGTDWITVGEINATANTWRPPGRGDAYEFDEASATEIRSRTADKLLVNDTVWGVLAPQSTTFATNLSFNFNSGGPNFTVTATSDFNLNTAPSAIAGKAGNILLLFSGGPWTCTSYHSNYRIPTGGLDFGNEANHHVWLSYIFESSSICWLSSRGNYGAP